jgi:DNA-binding response OmpR family regulator
MRPLLLLSDDEEFSQAIVRAARQTGRTFLRRHAVADGLRSLRLLKPAAVLFDLDSPAASPWDTADSLLRDENCPLLLLLTSRREQLDFETAIQAGSLIDKGTDAGSLLQLVDLKLESPASVHRQQNAMQRMLIRWLKPCRLLGESIPLHRFWGINE